jgi:hypothetical protein
MDNGAYRIVPAWSVVHFTIDEDVISDQPCADELEARRLFDELYDRVKRDGGGGELLHHGESLVRVMCPVGGKR